MEGVVGVGRMKKRRFSSDRIKITLYKGCYQRLWQSGWSHAEVSSIYIGANLLSAVSIGFFRAIGAWLSLIGVIVAIILGEIYLQSKKT